MGTLVKCFKLILTGDKETSRMAARKVRKLVYGSSGDRDKYDGIKELINSSSSEYAKISEAWRQENFVIAISIMYFLHDRESHPDFLFPWLYQLLQHENGNIRHAAVRMCEHELGPLTYHIRFPGKESGYSGLSREQSDRILFGLRSNLESLAASSYKPSYRRYKYIDSLPSGTYKSVQHILSCLDDYCSDIHRSMETETMDEIISRRKEIEQELVDMLKETESDFTLDHVRDAIFHEEDNDDMMKVVAMFDRGGDASELSNVLEMVTDAWNYFPHKILGGISPAEKILEYQNRK